MFQGKAGGEKGAGSGAGTGGSAEVLDLSGKALGKERRKSELDPETEGILLERNGAFQREKDPIPAGNFGFMECKTRKEL